MGLLGRRPIRHQEDEPILAVSGLSVYYGEVAALENVSFELNRGEQVAVVGPNGSGKSTLFKVVAGVLEPTEGRVMIHGHGPGGHICIGYVPQRSQVDWNFPVNVFDVVMMGRAGKLGFLRRPGPKDREYVSRCLEEVGLADLRGRQISELSGGEQQRMFVARALAQEAELVLMDEPLTGLDPESQGEIFRIFERLRRRRVTLVVATHDLRVAAERFDLVLLLNRRLVKFGPPAEVVTQKAIKDAYQGQVHLVEGDGETVAVDTWCSQEGDHD
jgi:manganese/iron transport system ATP-binding protein